MYPLPLVREVPPQKQILTHSKHATTAACPLFQTPPRPPPSCPATSSSTHVYDQQWRISDFISGGGFKIFMEKWDYLNGAKLGGGGMPPRKLLKISTPLEKISTQKNMLTINPPPIPFHFFYLFSFIFQKKSENFGGS